MDYETHLSEARSSLAAAVESIQREIQDYPTPISGCDAQYNYLIGLRGSVSESLRALEAPRFVATPRTPEPLSGVESR
ncbi:MAG: hypothetical protein OXQ92_11005 [Boseongicola sp.]|nr:hypothetical protein [Boseongicola sp.]MDD9976810.1 hypothetical protein [Boseongicola sp.]